MIPKVSIIIPFHPNERGNKLINKCLHSIFNQKNISYEIIVVLNEPNKELELKFAKLAKREPGFFYCVAKKRGVNRARNLGARKARAPFLYFLDEDCYLPSENFLQELLAGFQENPSVAGLGGPYLSLPNAPWSARGYNSLTKAWILNSAQALSSEKAVVKNLVGGNVCYKREFFQRGFAFDESIISGGDEIFLNHSLTLSGYKLLYLETLGVIHQPSSSMRSIFQRARNQGVALANMKRAGQVEKIQLRRKISLLAYAIRQEPSTLAFSLCHFPILYFHQLKRANKFPYGVKEMRG